MVFKWVNDFPEGKYPGLHHGTFRSQSMNVEVGYCIYLPPGYDDAETKSLRYPVVYWLHGGRPGTETKVISPNAVHWQSHAEWASSAHDLRVSQRGIVSHYDSRS